jgi:hypothetical protein
VLFLYDTIDLADDLGEISLTKALSMEHFVISGILRGVIVVWRQFRRILSICPGTQDIITLTTNPRTAFQGLTG